MNLTAIGSGGVTRIDRAIVLASHRTDGRRVGPVRGDGGGRT